MADPNAPAPPGYRVEEDPEINKALIFKRVDPAKAAASQGDALRRAHKAMTGEAAAAPPKAPDPKGLSVMGLRMGGAPKKKPSE